MEKKTNNYLLIIIVLLFVAMVIIGAGLCYLSWADEYIFTEQNGVAEGTELVENISTEINSAETSTEDRTESSISTELPQEVLDIPEISTETNTEAFVIEKEGIDVSKYQGNIDWKKVSDSGIEYVFVRVGCRGYGAGGGLIYDEKFHQNMKGALEQNMEVGAYFFSQAVTEAEVKEEAAMVISELEDYEVTYPVAIDIERVDNVKARQDALSKEERTTLCLMFCEEIEAAGYIPMVYGDIETFSELLDIDKLAEYDLWLCDTEGEPGVSYDYAVWQYSHTGEVSGIDGDTNLSISYKEW